MRDEQVVPSFTAVTDQVVPSLPTAPVPVPSTRKRKANPDVAPPGPAKRCVTPEISTTHTEAPSTADLGDGEVRLRPRWETPRRRGNWQEMWQSANELALPIQTRGLRKAVCAGVRSLVSRAVVLNVGLPFATVEKWLYLLAEYLELNADEHVLAVCLIRKYLKAGRSLVGENDWARPQRWECVVAISCYLSVLLSEEFPGRTAFDLKELLGSNFNFGVEQVSFLKAIDWKSSVSPEEFQSAMNVLSAPESTPDDKLIEWFGLGNRKEKVAPAAPPPLGKIEATAEVQKIPHIPQMVMPLYQPATQDIAHTVPSILMPY